MMISMFLSLDEDLPLAVWYANEETCGAFNLDEFLKESMIDMSKEQAERYAVRLQAFVDDLTAYK